MLFFAVSVIIFASLIVDLFLSINRISVHWSWSLSLGVLENFLWAISKPDINILFPHRFVEGSGEGGGWVFILVCFNWLIWLIQDIFQVIRSSLLLLIIDLCESFSLDQISLILKLVLGCARKLSVGCIYARHMYLLPLQVCGSSCQGYQFLLFCLSY